MAERHQRCRFWPHCEVHTGIPLDWRQGMAIFKDDEVQEMREQRAAGWTYTEIAARWDTTKQYAWYLVNRTRRGLSAHKEAPLPAG